MTWYFPQWGAFCGRRVQARSVIQPSLGTKVLEPRRRLASEKREVRDRRKPSGLSFDSKENPQFSKQIGIKRAQCRKL